MKYKGMLILLALVFLLGFYLLWIELPSQKAKKEEEEKAETVLQFDPGEAIGLSLTYRDRPEDPQLLLEKDPNGNWQIVNPIMAPADRAEMDRLLSSLQMIRTQRTVEEKAQDLKVYGLDDPEVKVSLRLRDHETHLLFGDPAPVGSSVYIKDAGKDSVHLVDQFHKTSLTKTLTEMRKKGILDVDPLFVKSVTLQYPGKAFVLSRENEKWWIKKPKISRADDETVSDLLDYLKRIRANDFIDQGQAELLETMGGPRLRAELQDESERIAKLSIYQSPNQEKVYALVSGEDTLYLIQPGAIEELDQDFFSLGDKHLLAFDPEKIERVEIERASDGVLVVQRDGKGWKFERDPLGEIQEARINDLVMNLLNIKAKEIVKETPRSLQVYGLDSPKYQVRLLDGEEKIMAELFLGGEDDNLRYAKAGFSETIYRIEDDLIENLPGKEDLKGQAEEEPSS
jgi:hypothetical protein